MLLDNHFDSNSLQRMTNPNPKGTFQLLEPIGALVTELWSFLLSSSIDLPLRQLV